MRLLETKNKVLLVAVPCLVILAALVVYQYGYLRLRAEIAQAREEEAAKLRTLAKSIAFIERRPELEQRLVSAKDTRKADESKLIQGQTPQVAAAALQNTVKAMITSRGGSISSERVDKPEDLGKFKVISVSIDAVLPEARALTEVLFALETQTPYLVVRELDARVRNLKEPRELMVRLRVAGLTGAKP